MNRSIDSLLPSRPHRLHCLALLCAALVAVTAGCAGVAIYFAVDAQVAVRDEGGRAWRAVPEDVTQLPVGSNAGSPFSMESPFSRVQYQHKAFVWNITVGESSINGTIRSKIASDVCLRFDQARLTSSTQSAEIPLRVFTGLQGRAYGMLVLGRSGRDRNKSVAPPQLCFTSKQTDFFWFKPDLSELFPNQRMFNSITPQNSVNPLERGIGNWLKMIVPIEYDGKREELELKLTATDSRAKLLIGF